MRRRILFVLCAMMLVLLIVGILFVGSQVAKARTITVDGSGGANYTKIQDAINASLGGDTVYVYNGTYNEQITVSKSINLTGEVNQNIVIKGDRTEYGSGIRIIADYVNVSNIKVTDFYYGIHLGYNSNITSNMVTNCICGIFLWQSSNNNIASNTITYCDDGVHFFSSSNNIMAYNMIKNTKTGIYLGGGGWFSDYGPSSGNRITSNRIEDSTICGLSMHNGDSNSVLSNEIYNNPVGILLDWTDSNYIANNKITQSKDKGIYLEHSDNNDIVSNSIENSGLYGIYLYNYSQENNITSNKVTNSGKYGIYIGYECRENYCDSNTISPPQSVVYELDAPPENLLDNPFCFSTCCVVPFLFLIVLGVAIYVALNKRQYPSQPTNITFCPKCRQPASYIQQYQRYWCWNCRKYL